MIRCRANGGRILSMQCLYLRICLSHLITDHIYGNASCLSWKLYKYPSMVVVVVSRSATLAVVPHACAGPAPHASRNGWTRVTEKLPREALRNPLPKLVHSYGRTCRDIRLRELKVISDYGELNPQCRQKELLCVFLHFPRSKLLTVCSCDSAIRRNVP